MAYRQRARTDRREQPSYEARALRLQLDDVGARSPLAARVRALALNQNVSLDSPRKDVFARVLHRQLTTDGIVDTLAGLADVLDGGVRRGAMSPTPPTRLTRLPVWPYPDSRHLIAMIPASDVVYAFTMAAITNGLLGVGWRLKASPREQRVFVRIDRFRARDLQGVGVLATPYRTLKDLVALLDPARFLWANQSIVVNRDHICEFEIARRVTLRVELAGVGKESVHVSRKHWRELRSALRLTASMSRPAVVAGVKR